MKTDAGVEIDKGSLRQLLLDDFHTRLQNPAGFRTVFTGTAAMNLKQPNRTDHLLQIPDISTCYRHRSCRGYRSRENMINPDNTFG